MIASFESFLAVTVAHAGDGGEDIGGNQLLNRYLLSPCLESKMLLNAAVIHCTGIMNHILCSVVAYVFGFQTLERIQ